MTEPLVCAPGDRFVARLASPVVTLGGGVLLYVSHITERENADPDQHVVKKWMELSTPY